MTKKLNKEQWVTKARAVHGDTYNYDISIYLGWRDKLTITCHKHGNFEQSAAAHLSGQGCKECTGSRAISREEFINKCRIAHGSRYDYGNVKYVNSKTKTTITCRIHGDFSMVAAMHVYGKGCAKCSRIQHPELLVAAKLGDQDSFTRILKAEGLPPVKKNTADKSTKQDSPKVDGKVFKRQQAAIRASRETIRSLLPISDDKIRALSSVKFVGAYCRRGVNGSINIYKGTDANDKLHYFYINNDDRIEITQSEIDRFWSKLY